MRQPRPVRPFRATDLLVPAAMGVAVAAFTLLVAGAASARPPARGPVERAADAPPRSEGATTGPDCYLRRFPTGTGTGA